MKRLELKKVFIYIKKYKRYLKYSRSIPKLRVFGGGGGVTRAVAMCFVFFVFRFLRERVILYGLPYASRPGCCCLAAFTVS
jgi:hypothetical protein